MELVLRGHGNPHFKKVLCAIALCEYVPVTPGNAGVEFCFLDFLWHCFTRTTRGVAGLSLAKAHLKKSEEIGAQVLTPPSQIFTHDG